MTFNETPLNGSYLISLEPKGDERGWFARTYCRQTFERIGHTLEWVQMNHSFTQKKGTIRGLHFQHPPFSEIKMVRCIAGAVFDVIVDIRKNSPTFLQWFGIELSADNKKMVYIPAGFAHGFQTISDDAELIYHHSEYYHPEAESGLRFDDPMIRIDWPLPVSELSARDAAHPLIDSLFTGI